MKQIPDINIQCYNKIFDFLYEKNKIIQPYKVRLYLSFFTKYKNKLQNGVYNSNDKDKVNCLLDDIITCFTTLLSNSLLTNTFLNLHSRLNDLFDKLIEKGFEENPMQDASNNEDINIFIQEIISDFLQMYKPI